MIKIKLISEGVSIEGLKNKVIYDNPIMMQALIEELQKARSELIKRQEERFISENNIWEII
jgi:c-di-GMP-binding flagellar brake protein YcgR